MTRHVRAVACAAAALVLGLALAGCTSPEPTPSSSRPNSDAPQSTPTPTETPVPEPVFDGTASENQAYFDWLNTRLIEGGGATGGSAFIENLVANGYPRENMEVTPDTTSIGVGADNVVFSIRFGDTCLLGQWGNIGYASLVTEVLSTGRCIVGTARPA